MSFDGKHSGWRNLLILVSQIDVYINVGGLLTHPTPHFHKMSMISCCIILLFIVNILNYEHFIFGGALAVTNVIYVGDGGPSYNPPLTFALPGNIVEWRWSKFTLGTYEVVQTTARNSCIPLGGGCKCEGG